MENINLSHSRADTFCGRQIYYRDVEKKVWVENYYTAMATSARLESMRNYKTA